MIIECNSVGFNELKKIISQRELIYSDRELKVELSRNDEFYGEIDLIFISYALIFLKSQNSLVIKVNFNEIVESAKYFKFAQVVNQVKALFPHVVKKTNFIVTGKYLLRTSGEIIEIRDYNSLGISKSFIPPILIEDIDSINKYFSKQYNLSNCDNTLIQLYLSDTKEKIRDNILDGRLSGENYASLRSKIELFCSKIENETSIFSIFLFNMLVEDFIVLRKKLDDKVEQTSARGRKNMLFERLEKVGNELIDLLNFIDNLNYGILELAKNIVQHSGSYGVISIRKFNKDVLTQLKGNINLNRFLGSQRHSSDYLDLNVLDLGSVNLKTHYIDNLEKTRREIIEVFENENIELPNASVTEFNEQYKQPILNSINSEFSRDLELMRDSSFSFKYLFIRDRFFGIENLSVQQNKFISKIGLQYFTTIIKDSFSGFIQVSSGAEKTCIFNNQDGVVETDSSDDESYILHGTYYTCYIPLNFQFIEKDYRLPTQEYKTEQDNNSFSELSKYNFIQRNQDVLDNYLSNSKNIIDFNADEYLNLPTEKIVNKYSILIYIYTELYKLKSKNPTLFSKPNDIIAISCQNLQQARLTNGSDWLRFVWMLTNYFENIILYDIDLSHFISIIHIRYHLNKSYGLSFWDDNSRILFYSKKTQKYDNEYFRYGANILAGSNTYEFLFLNRRIWNHHYSFKVEKFNLHMPDDNQIRSSRHLSSVFFTPSGNLHYYEIILSTATENENAISLFEKSVQYSLNTQLEDKHNDSTNNRGYKISNTHFKLGSKIHISDFYYAKKLFQNSFFTTPLAYSISQCIIESYLKREDILDDSVNSFTLVGYEDYSSFLVSSVRNFLVRFNTEKPKIEINHLIIKDGSISTNNRKLFKKVVIIVPIASTFNTALKIEDQLNEIIYKSALHNEHTDNSEIKNYIYGDSFSPEIEVIQPTQNVIWVGHRDKDTNIFENYFNANGELINESQNIYGKHDWKTIDKHKKVITLERYNAPKKRDIISSNNRERQQKYFIPVYTSWFEANDCTLCYPEKALDEKCLIETGKASITPQIIFGFPRTKSAFSVLKDLKDQQLLHEGSLLFGHLLKRNRRYLFYTRTEKLVEDNINAIITWIAKIKASYEVFRNRKVVIVTPNTGAKSRFLDLINEHLFEYTANCIIINLKEDYIENAETLYSDGIYSADLVIYVDDVLSTINSFLEVNYIVKYIRDKSSYGTGIDYCISLINRMAYENEDNLLLKLSDLNNFKEEVDSQTHKNRLIYMQRDFHPNIEEANNEFPLTLELNKYSNIEINSALDQIRLHFYQKKMDLKACNLDRYNNEYIKDYSLSFTRLKKRRNKKLYQYLVLNALYQLFEFNPENPLKDYKDARDKELQIYFPNCSSSEGVDRVQSEKCFDALIFRVLALLSSDSKHRHIIAENNSNIDEVILKVICSTPLIYYKPIRENALAWVLIKLERLIKHIEQFNDIKLFYKINTNSFYNYYQDLKFLLKKSVKLKSNFIIHNSTLEFYQILIDKININTSANLVEMIDMNKKFQAELNRLLEYEAYLNNPYIRLKLYDFIRNNLKYGILDQVRFGNVLITKEGLYKYDYGDSKKLGEAEEYNFNVQIIKDCHQYMDQSLMNNGNGITSNEGQLQLILDPNSMYEQTLLVQFEDLPLYNQFIAEFDGLLNRFPRYKTSSSKNFIIYIVALIQELTNEHEVKSVKLDHAINNLQKNRNGKNVNVNGSFEHLLRLMHLENIEIINKYTDDLIRKYRHALELKQNNNHEANKLLIPYTPNIDILSVLERDRKFRDLCTFQFENEHDGSQQSLASFISLKKYLKDSINNEKEDKIEIKMNLICNKIKNIIDCGDDSSGERVEDVFITVIYKDYENYSIQDTYTFSLKETSAVRRELIDNSESLCHLMGRGQFKTADNHLFSHFEVLKTEANQLVCREDINIMNLIKSTDQFGKLEKDRSIILIRISEFNKRKPTQFDTRAILTIYLKRAKRLKEKKLRLLLALRHNLLDFIKLKTQGSTLLELLNYEAEKKLIENNAHYLGHYLKNLGKNIKLLANYEEEGEILKKINLKLSEIQKQEESYPSKGWIEKESMVLLEAISAQINALDVGQLVVERALTFEEFKSIVDLLFGSGKIGAKAFDTNCYSFEGFIPSKQILLYQPQIDIIIPQIIINIKQYSVAAENSIKIIYENNYISFENYIWCSSPDNRIKGGRKISESIMKKILDRRTTRTSSLNDLISFKKDEERNYYTVKLKCITYE